MEDRVPRLTRVAVVGAGWAGCAAAVTLARLGYPVSLYEAAAIAGGRARRVERAGLPLDNGQHLMLGAYVQTRNLLAVVHGDDGESALFRMPLRLETFARDARPFRLRARPWPGRLGLLTGLLSAQGLTMRERIDLMAWFRRLERNDFRCDPAATVSELLASGPRAVAERLWNPLCLAALNTPPARASAQIFANVLRASFADERGASDFLFAARDLSSVFPEAAARFVAAHGGTVALGMRARVEPLADGVGVTARGRREVYAAAVVAVGPHQLGDTVERTAPFAHALDCADALAYEPIATVWLGYSRRTALAAPIIRLDDAPGQWAVDRPEVVVNAAAHGQRSPLAQLLNIVISAGGPHEALEHAALVSECDAQLRRLEPKFGAPAWSQVIVERRATYACVPNRPRPTSIVPHPRVALAGDWLDAEYPATLEAAVRSGVAAAFAIDQRAGRFG
jgi:hydroxysqualene dehydroxylase